MASVTVPLNMVGSTIFGRYPKISIEQTWNMIISDGWLVSFAGNKTVLPINPEGEGRGLYASDTLKKFIAVISEEVFLVDETLSYIKLGELETTSGLVQIDENNKFQIIINDNLHHYLYDYKTNSFSIVTIPFTPKGIAFQNGVFLTAYLDSTNPSEERSTYQWRLSDFNDGSSWPYDGQHIGRFQTKADSVRMITPVPGKGGLLMVMGDVTSQLWSFTGAQLFPYQLNSGVSIDYGCVNPDTVAASDSFVVWLGVNRLSGLAILYSDGGNINQISSDGINFRLSQLKNPEDSYGFIFKQDGHIIYVITFYNKNDNFSLMYDFSTGKFFNLSDDKGNIYPFKRVVYFNNKFYAISGLDGNIHELNSEISTSDGREIPRIRVCRNYRTANSDPFIVDKLVYTLEQGQVNSQQYSKLDQYKGLITLASDFPTLNTVQIGDYYNVIANVTDNDPDKTNTGQYFPNGSKIVWVGNSFALVNNNQSRVDLSISRDGGVTFGGSMGMTIQPLGARINKLIAWNLGMANDFTPQFRFWGMQRFVVTDGEMVITKQI